jgi:hypothetical protein
VRWRVEAGGSVRCRKSRSAEVVVRVAGSVSSSGSSSRDFSPSAPPLHSSGYGGGKA